MTIEKRWVRCTICGVDEFEPLYDDELGDRAPPVDHDFKPETRKTFAIVRCCNCGLVFTNPMPRIDALYSDTVDHAYLESKSQRAKTAKKVLREIMVHQDNGALLDIGCNIGIFLDQAAEAGFQVEGIELSKWARELAMMRHRVHDKSLAELAYKSKFDVITMFGVIEHLETPSDEIRNITLALKSGGHLVIYTGDRDAWLPRLLGKRWWWYQGMHVHYFSRRTIERLLVDCGFEIVRHSKYTVYFRLFSLAKSINRYQIGRLVTPLLHLPFIRNILVGISLPGEMLTIARLK